MSKLKCGSCNNERERLLVTRDAEGDHLICFDCFVEELFDGYVDYDQIAREVSDLLTVSVAIDEDDFEIVMKD